MPSFQAGVVLSVMVLMALDNVYKSQVMNFIIAQSPSDELRMDLLSSGFPTDGSSLGEVQHLVSLLNQTRLSNPIYVHSLFVAHYMGRIMFPMMDWQLILWFVYQCYVWISSDMGFDENVYRVAKPIFPTTTNFYLYTAAGALYGKWGGTVLCITLSTLANEFSLCIIRLVLMLFHGFMNRRARAVPQPLPNLLDQAQIPALPDIPALPELDEPEVEEEEPAPPTNWAYIQTSIVLFIVGAPLLPLVPSWLPNCLLAHIYMMAREAEYPRALILLMPALGRIPFLWYCVSTGPGIHQLDSLEGVFNCGFMYVAAFVGSLIVMATDLLSHLSQNLF